VTLFHRGGNEWDLLERVFQRVDLLGGLELAIFLQQQPSELVTSGFLGLGIGGAVLILAPRMRADRESRAVRRVPGDVLDVVHHLLALLAAVRARGERLHPPLEGGRGEGCLSLGDALHLIPFVRNHQHAVAADVHGARDLRQRKAPDRRRCRRDGRLAEAERAGGQEEGEESCGSLHASSFGRT
jgi:hypothetical protein